VSDAAQRLGSAALGYEDSPTRPPGAGAPVNYLAAMLTYLAKVHCAFEKPRPALAIGNPRLLRLDTSSRM
jgi:hypothetical protein